jgi:hypothetical protein
MLLVCPLILINGEILQIDSIINDGHWTDPSNVLVSDDMYGLPHQHNDEITVGFEDPGQQYIVVDSVFVMIEQYVTDSVNGFWQVEPEGAIATELYAGTLEESVIRIDISYAVTTEQGLIDLQAHIIPHKTVGSQPEWFADHVYLDAYYTYTSIQESTRSVLNMVTVPSIAQDKISFTCIAQSSATIEITLVNVMGQTVVHERARISQGRNDFIVGQGAGFAPGVYFLSLCSDSEVTQHKVLLVK